MRLLFESFLLLALSFPTALYAQSQTNPVEGFDPQRDYISSKYVAGPRLIYDCADKHWACVEETSYQNCQESHDKDTTIGRTELSCFPSLVFATKRECYARIRQLVVRGDVPRLCLLPRERQRFIGFR